MTWNLLVVVVCRGYNTRSASGDNVDVGGYIGDSRRRQAGAEKRISPECRVPKVQGVGERLRVSNIQTNDVMSMEVQWRDNGARRKALTASLVDANN